jgi:hypothetical protein
MRLARAALVLGLAGAVVAGCRLPSEALDGPLAVPLRIDATPEAIDIDAPGWFAAETAVYLCHSEPPGLPEPGPDRDGWTPGPACHDFGRVAAADGLHVALRLAELTEAERSAFAAVADWFVLLVKLDGDRATAAIRSSFNAPAKPAT